MKKWIAFYIVTLLAVLAVFGCVNGLHDAKQAAAGQLCQEDGYISQVLKTQDREYVVYQNPEQEKLQVVRTDKDEWNSETLATVHQNGVHYLFQYTDSGKQYIGIESLGVAKTATEDGETVTVPVFETKGDFLAAGADENAVFCSVLSENGRTITEYTLSAGTQVWVTGASVSIPEGHFVVCAAYEGDTLWLAREDGSIFSWNTALKEKDTAIENTVLYASLKHGVSDEVESIWKTNCIKEAVGKIILLALIAAAVITGMMIGIRRKNNLIFQMICAAEIVALIAVLYAGYSFIGRMTQEEVLETGIEAGHVLEDMKQSQRGDGTVEPSAYWTAMKQKEGLLEDLIILDTETDEVLLAKNLPSGEKINTYYGEDVMALTAQVQEGTNAVMTTLQQGDREVYAVALRDWTEIQSDSILLAVLSENGIQNSIAGSVAVQRNVVGGLLALVSICNAVIFLFFANRWQKFENGLTYVATEKKAYTDMPAVADGLQSAWASLDDIGNSLSRLYYERNLLYRSYYKFVPKGMDVLLKKPVLADIEVGDRTKVRGCMVDIVLNDMKKLDGAEYLDRMTKSMELMHKARERRDGIFLSASTDLQERKLFFEKNAAKALQFSIDMIHAYAENSLLADNDYILMLHAAEFQYGVSGIKEMMVPYMYSQQERILEPYAKILARAKVKIVLTEQTVQLIGDGYYTRYIGFISGGEEVGSLKLYEGLDAYSESQRKLMMETNVMFQRGLQLFYSNDFYLARNTFNEVLKLNEKDHIARWYLFHCEYQLNNPDAEVCYGLYENQVYVQ